MSAALCQSDDAPRRQLTTMQMVRDSIMRHYLNLCSCHSSTRICVSTLLPIARIYLLLPHRSCSLRLHLPTRVHVVCLCAYKEQLLTKCGSVPRLFGAHWAKEERSRCHPIRRLTSHRKNLCNSLTTWVLQAVRLIQTPCWIEACTPARSSYRERIQLALRVASARRSFSSGCSAELCADRLPNRLVLSALRSKDDFVPLWPE